MRHEDINALKLITLILTLPWENLNPNLAMRKTLILILTLPWENKLQDELSSLYTIEETLPYSNCSSAAANYSPRFPTQNEHSEYNFFEIRATSPIGRAGESDACDWSRAGESDACDWSRAGESDESDWMNQPWISAWQLSLVRWHWAVVITTISPSHLGDLCSSYPLK